MLPEILGGVAAAGGALANWMQGNEDADRAVAAYNTIKGLAESTGNANQADIDRWKTLVSNTYGADSGAKYSEALEKFLNSPVYQNNAFSYNKDISQFMDPAANQRVDAAMQAIENSAASGGNRFSSDFISRVGAKQQALASEEWEKAYNRLMQDRQMALSEYNTNSNNAWNNYNAQNDRAKYGIDAYGQNREGYMGGMSDALSAGIQNRTGVLNSQAQAISGAAKAQEGTGGWGLVNGLMGAGGQFLSKFYGKDK